jgi:hypothetical protein
VAVGLEIRLEGEAPGLAEHRLSLGAFGPSLEKLLDALRRIASGVVRDARDPDYYAPRGGRYAREANLLDVQIETIEEGSLKLALVLALQVVSGQENLFDDLPERTAVAFVRAVESEGHARMENAMVRRYLSSLPEGVTAQGYRATRDGAQLAEVRLGKVSLPDDVGELPALLQADVPVTGVGFAPGKPEVRVLVGPQTIRCEATAEQVEAALGLRGRVATVTAVIRGKAGRLVAIRNAAEVPPGPTEDQRTEALFVRWDELLRRLAQ